MMLLTILLALTLNGASPLDQLKNTIENIKLVVSDQLLKTADKRNAKDEQINYLLHERMDLEDIAKKSLGGNWNKISAEEKKEYTALFLKYIRVYHRQRFFNNLEYIDKSSIKYVSQKIDGDYSEVEISIPSRSKAFTIIFKMHLVGSDWKVYDMIIENVSEVNNFRSQFNRILAKNSFYGLINILKERILEMDNNGKL